MYKRKIMGILKYGTRGYTRKNTGFQEGGTVAVKSLRLERRSYELMLLQQKAKLLQGFAGRKAASSSSGIKKSILF
jgi:hypothetical protein